MMNFRVLSLLIALSMLLSSPGVLADWKIAKSVEQRSTIYLSGYMDEMFIYQTEKDIAGSKLVYGTRGSGTASRTMATYADEDEIYFNVRGEFHYRPYRPMDSESDLRKALRAKNLEVGTVVSGSYTGGVYLIRDATPSNDDGVIIHQIGSSRRPTVGLGSW
jgi:hypothetical protein